MKDCEHKHAGRLADIHVDDLEASTFDRLSLKAGTAAFGGWRTKERFDRVRVGDLVRWREQRCGAVLLSVTVTHYGVVVEQRVRDGASRTRGRFRVRYVDAEDAMALQVAARVERPA